MKFQIDVSQLKLGMYVCELDRPWLDTPFLFQGFPLRHLEDIEKIKESCQFVYIDSEKGIVSASIKPSAGKHTNGSDSSAHSEHEPIPACKHTVSIEEEIKHACDARQHANRFIESVFKDISSDQEIDLSNIKPIVGKMVNSVIHNPDAQLCLTQLKRRDQYTAQHSINVCVLSIAFARHLGLNRSALNEIGMGAILHDIGKLRVPLEILNKPGKLTDEEFMVMKRHPELGAALLSRLPDIPFSVLEIVEGHHERVEGHGYPKGKRGEHTGNLCKMVSIVDVYDAISSDRAYHDGKSPTETLLKMYEGRKVDFDHDLLEQFIQCIGIYPIGSLVELTSGEVGITISINRQFRLKPKVLLIRDSDKNPYFPTRIVDLAMKEPQHDGNDEIQYGIQKVLVQGAHNIDIREHLQPILEAKTKSDPLDTPPV